MSILLVQIFLLLLGSFLVGAVAAYLFRRAFGDRPVKITPTPPAPPPGSGGTRVEHDPRFERALTGGQSSMVPPPFQRAGTPMVEVQPILPARASTQAAAAAPQPKPAPPAPEIKSAPPPPPPPPPKVAAPEPPKPPAPEPTKAPTPPPPVETYASVAVAAAAATRAAAGPADNLTRIHAIDADIARRLVAGGVSTFTAIAKWSAPDIERVSQALGLGSRIDQENWVGQAAILARGGAPADMPPKVSPAPPSQPAGPDRLHRINGIDAETEKALIENGVTRFSEIAAWTSDEIEQVEAYFGTPGRVGLENWIGQAKVLARSASNGSHGATAPPPASPPTPAPTQASVSRLPTAAPPAPEPPRAPPRPAEFQGLRSVRSEALRREPLSTSFAFDDLKRIRGIGVLIEKKLNSLGITSYEQIANWTGADIDRMSQILDFKGRIEREGWVEQARILASGGATEFSRRADRGEIESNRPRG